MTQRVSDQMVTFAPGTVAMASELVYSNLTGSPGRLPLPAMWLQGLNIANNAGDATNDIDIAEGQCRDATNTNNLLLSAITKQLDVAWVVGTNQGMLATGVGVTNTTYHLFAILRPDTGVVDIAADTSVTGANVTANTNAAYTKMRRIASIMRVGGVNTPFVQDGDYFRRKASIQDVSTTNPGTGAVTATLSVPTGLNLLAFGNANVIDTAQASIMYLSDLAANDEAPSHTAAPQGQGAVSASAAYIHFPWTIRSKTSSQIRSRMSLSGASNIVHITTLGWFDSRGRT